MIALRKAATEYLAIRRGLGFKLRGHDRLLDDFIDYLERSGLDAVTVGAALAWATGPSSVSPIRWSQRLSAVRGFTRHLQCLDRGVKVPPGDLLTIRRSRPTPYLYSDGDVVRLLTAARALRPTLRGATCEAVFGLLAATGMRIGEVIALDRDDVDLDHGVIEINDAKFRKHRRLPLHRSCITALLHYAEIRDSRCPRPGSPSFFISTRGTRLCQSGLHASFRKLAEEIGLFPAAGVGRPTVHGLRHSFAVASLRDWHEEGADPTGKLSVLSAYLGHADPAYTYWYLQACPELLGLAGERLARWEEGR